MNKLVLVLNCGSSSVKFAVINPEDNSEILSGLAECMGSPEAVLTIKADGKKDITKLPGADHEKTLAEVVKKIPDYLPKDGKIASVGHRIVHGGELFKESCLINDEVMAGIKQCAKLAPLHNPANILGIEAAQKSYPDLPQIAVFDTAFHQTIPEEAYLYAVPYKYYKENGLRRYGFHGTSFRYICSVMNEYLENADKKKIIIAHLGNGGSVAAINNGKVIDTSMGLTPLEGLVHGTRSGDLDPSIIEFLCNQTGQSVAEITEILWKESGLLGLSEITNDCRRIEQGVEQNETASIRALSVYIYRLTKYIASYAGALNGVDAIVFTGGIGENSSYIREKVAARLSYLGFEIDKDRNNAAFRGKSGKIVTDASTPMFVIPTDEESMIALDANKLA